MTSRLDANLLSVQICSGVYLHSHDENLHTMQIYTYVKNIHMCKSPHVNDPLIGNVQTSNIDKHACSLGLHIFMVVKT